MNIEPIKNEDAYEAALERIKELFDAKQNTPEGDELEVLITLVSAYEDRHYKIDPTGSIEAGKRIMEARDIRKIQKK